MFAHVYWASHGKNYNIYMCVYKFRDTSHFCFIWKIMYHIKRNWLWFDCPQQTSMDYYEVMHSLQWFLASDFFVSQSSTKCQIFLFMVIFRSWPFNKKWSAIKDCSNVIHYDYVQIITIFCLTTSLRHNILYVECISFSLHFQAIVFY